MKRIPDKYFFFLWLEISAHPEQANNLLSTEKNFAGINRTCCQRSLAFGTKHKLFPAEKELDQAILIYKEAG